MKYRFWKCCPLRTSSLSLLPIHHVEKSKVEIDSQINYRANKANCTKQKMQLLF